MTSTVRPGKRKREQDRLEKLRQYGVDLSDIRGLPVQVIPLHVHALTKAAEVFRTSAAAAAGPVHRFSPTTDVLLSAERMSQSEHESDIDSMDVLGDLLGRIDQQRQLQQVHRLPGADSDVDVLQVGQRVPSQTRDSMHDLKSAVDAWLDAIRRFHRDSFPRGQPGQASSVPVPIPLAAFQHLWHIAMNQEGGNSIATQRAALYLCGQLLCKSADCRQWLLDANSQLSAWVEHTAQPPVSVSRTSPSQIPVSIQWKSFQQESCFILEHLVQLGYEEVYPTIAVALQRLQSSASLDSTTSAASLMKMWRRSRDTALEHYQREISRVHRLIRRAYAYMDVLVPRLSVGPSPQYSSLSHQETDSDDENESTRDEEDSLLDWEDGCLEEEPPGSSSADQANLSSDRTGAGHAEPHDVAVERTLMTMQATAAVQNGAIEIHLGSPSLPVTCLERAGASLHRARDDLKECIQLLRSRHMPRLSAWVEGLTSADNLIPIYSESGTSPHLSLSSMPRAVLERRAEVTRRLLDVKQSVASVLASAKKLGVYLDEPAATADVALPNTSGNLGPGWTGGASASRQAPQVTGHGWRTMPRNKTRARVRIKLGL